VSELFNDDPREDEPVRTSRRSRALVITAIVVIAAFFALTTFASVYTDRLWYKSVGYGEVFSTLLWTRIALFAAFGLLMAVAVGASIFVAYRYRPLFRPQSPEQTNLDRYRDAVTPIRTWLLIGVSLVIGAFAGASGMGQWRNFLLWRNSVPFDQKDAYFEKDIGFYVFELPWLHYLVDFAMAAAVIALIAGAVVHYLYGGLRLQASHDRLSGAAQVQLSVLAGIFVLAKAADYYLDRFDLVNESNRLFTGMNNTGENAVLPAKNILLGVALICAVLFFLNIWRRTWQLPGVGLALLVLSSILLGMIWPAIVQQFQVKPSEADKEASYIKANIDATLAAYDLSDVDYETYSSTVTDTPPQAELAGQVSQVPLVDPKLVFQTFEQRQQARAYYTVANVLDVDRYEIDGRDTPLVLGVRELDQSGINTSDQNWSNLHTVYTHGEGIIAAYANETTDVASSNDDNLAWAEGIESNQDDLSEATGGYEDRIYFGEKSPEYSVVGKASEGANDVELGLGGTDAEEDQTTTYDGDGGVSTGSAFNQLMYAIKFGEANFVLSGRVNENSKVLYIREPRERVEKVAPWLTIDSDAYPAVVDGKVVWILDGYTTTDRYPNSQRESFADMIDDSLQESTGLQTLPTDEINYMRSAVKATVDAYDGTVTLYAWDEEDPILKAWRGAFPDSVQDKDEIPDELMQHLRYPEDLFKVQRYQLARYHVTDAGDFYQGSDRWEVPEDPNSRSYQPPYRVFANAEGAATGENEWALTSVYVPRGKGNLASFVSVNSDATSDDFGKFKVLRISESNAFGPGQVANEMAQDDEVVEKLQPFRVEGSTPPIFGNLLTLPVNEGLIYIEPVYAVRAGASGFPILQYVLVSYDGEVGIGTTLTQALADAVGVSIEPPDNEPPDNEPPDNEPPDNEPPDNTGTVNQQIAQLLRQADAAFDAADAAYARGNLVEGARQTEKAQELIAEALALVDQRDGGQPATP
jgi:uncharacterized membrane protein (UPF0182 family)